MVEVPLEALNPFPKQFEFYHEGWRKAEPNHLVPEKFPRWSVGVFVFRIFCCRLINVCQSQNITKYLDLSVFLIEIFIKVYGVSLASLPGNKKTEKRAENKQSQRLSKSFPRLQNPSWVFHKDEVEAKWNINTWQCFQQSCKKVFWHLNILWYHSLNKSFPFGCFMSNAKWFILRCLPHAKTAFIIYGILLGLCELCMPFKSENVDGVK